jgi:gamma-tubulin complex component 5
MCLLFSEGFMTMVGDTTTLDVSRQSISMKHRSRRLKRQQKNVIGFSQMIQEEDSSDDEEDVVGDDAANEPPELSLSVSGVHEEDFPSRVERMASELDGLVRFLRRGVESLAGGSTEAAPAFGVFAFALEDWDM